MIPDRLGIERFRRSLLRGTEPIRRRRHATIASIVAIAAFLLLAAGCGAGGAAPGVAGVPSSAVPSAARSSATTSRTNVLLLVGRCLRQHGLANLPDPTIATFGPAKGQAVLDKQAMHSFSQSSVTQAMTACRTVLERAGIGHGSSERATPEEIRDGIAFARCVRRHGILNFPDPDSQGNFNLAGTGINPHALSPTQLAVARACLPAAHGAIHIPAQAANPSNG
jgi:hypothetical protein